MLNRNRDSRGRRLKEEKKTAEIRRQLDDAVYRPRSLSEEEAAAMRDVNLFRLAARR